MSTVFLKSPSYESIRSAFNDIVQFNHIFLHLIDISPPGCPQVSWVRHNDVSLISVGKYKYIKDSRFRVMNEYPKLQDWELVINDVRLKDQGQYECQVNTSPILQQAFFLSVVGKKKSLYIAHWT